MIDEAAKGTVFFRFAISPDPKKENARKDLDLWGLTRQVMIELQTLKKQDIQFFAVEHNDHTDIPHIHAVVLLKGKIFRQDIQVLRQAVTQHALFQRRARDLVQHFQVNRSYAQRYIGIAGGRARRIRKASEPTIPCPYGGMHAMTRLENNKYWCPVHKRVHEKSAGLSL